MDKWNSRIYADEERIKSEGNSQIVIHRDKVVNTKQVKLHGRCNEYHTNWSSRKIAQRQYLKNQRVRTSQNWWKNLSPQIEEIRVQGRRDKYMMCVWVCVISIFQTLLKMSLCSRIVISMGQKNISTSTLETFWTTLYLYDVLWISRVKFSWVIQSGYS